MNRKFLWVNKDESEYATPRSQRKPRSSPAVNRFVQRQRERRSTGIAVGSWPRTTRILIPRSSQQDSQSSALTLTPADAITTQGQHRKKLTSNTFQGCDDRLFVANFLDGSAVDPFSAAPTTFSRDVEILLKYHQAMVVTGSHISKNEILPYHTRYTEQYVRLGHRVVRESMHDEAVLCSLLASMAAHIGCISQVQLPDVQPTAYYLQPALASLRHRLSVLKFQGKEAVTIVLRVIRALTLTEWLCGRLDSARLHLEAAKKLLPLSDVGSEFGKFALEGCQGTDLFVAVDSGEPPLLPPIEAIEPSTSIDDISDYLKDVTIHPGARDRAHAHSYVGPGAPKSDLLDDAWLSIDLRLGRGFQAAVAAGVIDASLQHTFRDLADCLALAKYVWLTDKATSLDADAMCRKARRLLHQLCHETSHDLSSNNSVQAARSQCLRLALLLFLANAVSRTSFRSARFNVGRLQSILLQGGMDWNHPDSSEQPADGYDMDQLLLWVLMTGHFYSHGTKYDVWFCQQAAQVATKLCINSTEGLHEHVVNFLCSSTKQMHSFRTVALLL